MSILGAGAIAGLRAVVQNGFPDTFSVSRQPMVDDGYGHQQPSGPPTTPASGACLLQETPAPGAERDIAARLGLVKPAVLTVPVGTDITEKDSVTVNGTRTFRIVDVAPGGTNAVRVRVLLDEVT